MSIFSTSVKIFLISLLLIIPFWASAHNSEHLGQISFPTTGKKEAQPFFEKGVMLLHSFQYDDAIESFQKAEAIDPNFALAYWGEALAYNHPLWGEQDKKRAVNALNKFAKTPQERVAKAKSKKEKELINTINILYGEGSKTQRDSAYVDATRELYEQYPNDDEIASLYALALVGATESERDFRSYMQSAGVMEDIYERNKSHPGALHYLIHMYDDPIHAPLGLRTARAYAKTAPDASHALHMPSHIYTALGMWDDVIQSNEAAWNAGEKANTTHNPKLYIIHDLHALQWLSYAHLQNKNYKKSYELTKQMETIALKANSPMAKWYYAFMRSSYIVETGDFKTDLKIINLKGVELSAIASNIYANVLIAENKNDVTKMTQLLNELTRQIPNKIPNKTYDDYFISVTASGIKTAKITQLEIQARIAALQGRLKDAIQFATQATEIEEQMSFGYGPPIPIEPSYELLAEYLFKNKQYTESYKQYVVALKRMPNRLKSKEGLEKTKAILIANKQPVPEGIKPYFNRLIKPEFFH